MIWYTQKIILSQRRRLGFVPISGFKGKKNGDIQPI